MSLFLQTLVLRGILSGEQGHRLEEFHMKKILIQYGICALAVALMVPLAHAQSLKQNSCEVKRHFLSAGRCQFYARP